MKTTVLPLNNVSLRPVFSLLHMQKAMTSNVDYLSFFFFSLSFKQLLLFKVAFLTEAESSCGFE